MKKQLVILSGPSCVGKGPLAAAVKKFKTEIKYDEIPVIKSRESRGGQPRPDDESKWKYEDYWRSAEEIMDLKKNPRYLVGDCRGFPQAIDLEKVAQSQSALIFIEVYHTIGRQLVTSKYLAGVTVTSVFLSPIGISEIESLRVHGICVTTEIKERMVRKQEKRAAFQGKELDPALRQDITARAEDAVDELRSAPDYNFVLVNDDGEGAENWKRDPEGNFTDDYPTADAGRALESLADILHGERPDNAETWPHGTV
jgi:guanylate kinase